MCRKFIWTLFIVVFLCGTNNAIGMETELAPICSHMPSAKLMQKSHIPNTEEWRDKYNHPAPPNIRVAADNLWSAVEIEGEAAFSAGWCLTKKPSCGCTRCCLCFFSCGISECSMANTCEEFGWNGGSNAPGRLIYEQKKKEMMTALDNFKECVNESVLEPEQYSKDANVCKLGPWVEDGSWNLGEVFFSGRRDLSNVPRLTKKFVNEHGGWINGDNKTNLKTQK